METVLSSLNRQSGFRIEEASAISAARRHAAMLARNTGFDETAAGQVALVVTEAATNILKHAGQGEILIRPLQFGAASGIEIIALDSGPGISDIWASMRDGCSTVGSYGVGLGVMQRVADEFDIYSAPGKGTVIAMAIWAKSDVPPSSPLQIGVVCLPMPGETECGDAWSIMLDPTVATMLVADGLGHGPEAAKASEGAVAVMAQFPETTPGNVLQDIHAALRSTRGAAVAVMRLDMMAERLWFAGIGNIAVSICEMDSRHQMVSHNGIVGSNMRKVQEFAEDWDAGSTVVMHSDGLGSRWDLKQYPGLTMRHPGIIAAVLYRDFARKRDDMTVLVVRENQGN